jgi:hypothetical protein
MQMMLNDMGIVDDPVVCAHPSTAIVPRMVPLDGMAELVSRLGGELQPLDLQRRLVTQLFWARRAHERNLQHKELAQVTQWVRVAKDIRGIDLSKFIVPEGGFLRQFTWSKFPMLQWCDPSLKRVIATVTKLSRQRSDGNKTAEALLKHWEQEHTCEPDQSFERIGDLPTSAKPLPCFTYGRCVCHGRGKLMHMSIKQLCSKVSCLSPKKSELRALITQGSIVLKFGDRMFHLGLLYRNPLRAVVVELQRDDPPSVHGHDAYQALTNDRGWLKVMLDIDVAEELNLDMVHTVQLFRFVTFD